MQKATSRSPIGLPAIFWVALPAVPTAPSMVMFFVIRMDQIYPPAELFARALQQGVGAPRSELLVRRPEKNLLVAATCFPLFDGDRLTGAVAILEDSTGNQRQITHQVQLGIDGTRQKQSEEEMQRLEGLHLIGQMAAGISHEIRNPLTTVRGFLQVLSKKDGCSDYKEFFFVDDCRNRPGE